MPVAANEKILYTVREVSELLHTKQGFVYDLIRVGLLPALKLGAYKVRREALYKFLEENEGMDLRDPANVSTFIQQESRLKK